MSGGTDEELKDLADVLEEELAAFDQRNTRTDRKNDLQARLKTIFEQIHGVHP